MENEVKLDQKAIDKAEKKIYLAVNEMKIPDVLTVIGNVLVNIAASITSDTMNEDVGMLFNDYLDNLKISIREAIDDTLNETIDNEKPN